MCTNHILHRGGAGGEKPQEVFALAGVNFSCLPSTDFILHRDRRERRRRQEVLACVFFRGFAVIFEDKGSYGFNAAGTIASSGAFIFILLLDQVNLRNTIAVAGIVYIEALYFVLYIIILLVTINALLIASNMNLTILRDRDNLIPKLMYWPTLLILSLAVTLITFY